MEKILKLAIMAWSEMRWAERVGPRMAAATVCAIFAFIAALAAAGCVMAAFWIYIAPQVGPAGASLWSGLLLAVIGGGLALGSRAIFRDNGSRRAGPMPGLSGMAVPDEVLIQFRKTVGNNKTASLVSAVLAGLAAGAAQRR